MKRDSGSIKKVTYKAASRSLFAARLLLLVVATIASMLLCGCVSGRQAIPWPAAVVEHVVKKVRSVSLLRDQELVRWH